MSSVVPPSRRNLLLRAIRFFERIINAACILAYQFFATLSQENKLIFLSLSLSTSHALLLSFLRFYELSINFIVPFFFEFSLFAPFKFVLIIFYFIILIHFQHRFFMSCSTFIRIQLKITQKNIKVLREKNKSLINKVPSCLRCNKWMFVNICIGLIIFVIRNGQTISCGIH